MVLEVVGRLDPVHQELVAVAVVGVLRRGQPVVRVVGQRAAVQTRPVAHRVVAIGVVNSRRQARAVFVRQAPVGVVLVGGRRPRGVCDDLPLPAWVQRVGVGGQDGPRLVAVDQIRQPVGRVVGVRRHHPVRQRQRLAVAVRVVAVGAGAAAGVVDLPQPVVRAIAVLGADRVCRQLRSPAGVLLYGSVGCLAKGGSALGCQGTCLLRGGGRMPMKEKQQENVNG